MAASSRDRHSWGLLAGPSVDSNFAIVGTRLVGAVRLPATCRSVGPSARTDIRLLRVVVVRQQRSEAVSLAEVLQLPVLAVPPAQVEGHELRLCHRK